MIPFRNKDGLMPLKWSKEGLRGERLASFLLSKLAFISESEVHEDYGIDFYCALYREEIREIPNNKGNVQKHRFILFDEPFHIQIKTKILEDIDIVDKNEIAKKRENGFEIPYNKDSIKMLQKLAVPFFVGWLDLASQSLHLYSTNPMFEILNLHRGVIDDIEKMTLEFDNPNAHRDIEGQGNLRTKKNMTVLCGGPIITLDLKEDRFDTNSQEIEDFLKEEAHRTKDQRRILQQFIRIGFENIHGGSLGLPMYRWNPSFKSNSFDEIAPAIMGFLEDDDLSTVDEQMQIPIEAVKSMHYQLISLASIFKFTNKPELYEATTKLFALIPEKERNTNFPNAIDSKIYGAETN